MSRPPSNAFLQHSFLFFSRARTDNRDLENANVWAVRRATEEARRRAEARCAQAEGRALKAEQQLAVRPCPVHERETSVLLERGPGDTCACGALACHGHRLTSGGLRCRRTLSAREDGTLWRGRLCAKKRARCLCPQAVCAQLPSGGAAASLTLVNWGGGGGRRARWRGSQRLARQTRRASWARRGGGSRRRRARTRRPSIFSATRTRCCRSVLRPEAGLSVFCGGPVVGALSLAGAFRALRGERRGRGQGLSAEQEARQDSEIRLYEAREALRAAEARARPARLRGPRLAVRGAAGGKRPEGRGVSD